MRSDMDLEANERNCFISVLFEEILPGVVHSEAPLLPQMIRTQVCLIYEGNSINPIS